MVMACAFRRAGVPALYACAWARAVMLGVVVPVGPGPAGLGRRGVRVRAHEQPGVRAEVHAPLTLGEVA